MLGSGSNDGKGSSGSGSSLGMCWRYMGSGESTGGNGVNIVSVIHLYASSSENSPCSRSDGASRNGYDVDSNECSCESGTFCVYDYRTPGPVQGSFIVLSEVFYFGGIFAVIFRCF